MKLFDDISKTIGNTPLVKINRLNDGNNNVLLAKLESQNPTFSVKDRISVNMIDQAEKDGLLNQGSLIIEPTSGNTGIGLACIAAARGYSIILTMPETMSIERRKVMEHFGAKIILTPGPKGMKGAIEKAKELKDSTENSFMPQQFKNPANPDIHRKTTALEIWNDTDGKVDIVVAGIGTGGTITGVGEVLKEKNPEIKIIGVEPEASAVLSGNPAGPHKIQGIGAGFIPEILNTDIIDEVIQVKDEDAFKAAKDLARKEGILCGISCGAAFHASLNVCKNPDNNDKTIVVILPDTGERYLSTTLFEGETK